MIGFYSVLLIFIFCTLNFVILKVQWHKGFQFNSFQWTASSCQHSKVQWLTLAQNCFVNAHVQACYLVCTSLKLWVWQRTRVVIYLSIQNHFTTTSINTHLLHQSAHVSTAEWIKRLEPSLTFELCVSVSGDFPQCQNHIIGCEQLFK